jgi:hypothetical protein
MSKLGVGMRAPQFGQNRVPLETCSPHLLHSTSSPDAGRWFGGGRLLDFERGSSATAAPHRVHCGTPIGVNAVHASQTRPTSIEPSFYPPKI